MLGWLATLAIGTHALLWVGVVADAEVGAWLLFGVELAWLLVVVWLMASSHAQMVRATYPFPRTPASDMI
jgi:hypothetical protein